VQWLLPVSASSNAFVNLGLVHHITSMENKSAEELLAAVDDARQLVEIVRSGGRKLMEIMTCLHEIVDTKQTISAMAKVRPPPSPFSHGSSRLRCP
jgi:hypothetical protein